MPDLKFVLFDNIEIKMIVSVMISANKWDIYFKIKDGINKFTALIINKIGISVIKVIKNFLFDILRFKNEMHRMMLDI